MKVVFTSSESLCAFLGSIKADSLESNPPLSIPWWMASMVLDRMLLSKNPSWFLNILKICGSSSERSVSSN